MVHRGDATVAGRETVMRCMFFILHCTKTIPMCIINFHLGIEVDPEIIISWCWNILCSNNFRSVGLSSGVQTVWINLLHFTLLLLQLQFKNSISPHRNEDCNVSSRRVSWVHLSSYIVFYVHQIHLLNEMIVVYLLAHTKTSIHMRTMVLKTFLIRVSVHETDKKKPYEPYCKWLMLCYYDNE